MSKRMVEDYTFSKNLNFLVLPDPLGSYFLKFKRIHLKSRRKIKKSITIGFIAQEKNSCVKNIRLANEIINKVSIVEDIQFLRIGNLNPRDLPKIFAELDLLLLTSHYEGFPNVVKEALFMGVPFASTDVSDLRLASTFIPGSFVCSGSSSEFADKILSNIRLGLYSKQTDLDEIAYVNYISQFYPSHSAKKLISFYYKILKND
jgi:glycosyltransferase involved in cell wall biosynthesis